MTDRRITSSDPLSDLYVERALGHDLGEFQEFITRTVDVMHENDPEAQERLNAAVTANVNAALDCACEGSEYALDQLLSYMMLAITSTAQALQLLDTLETTFEASKIVGDAG